MMPYAIRFLLLMFMALQSVPASSANSEDQIAVLQTYSFGGRAHVFAGEGSLSSILLGLWAPLKVHADGSVTGTGPIMFEWLRPCSWEAPEPVDNNNCVVKKVNDGAFSISGRVTEIVHRHDEDNPFKNDAFKLLDFLAEDQAHRLGRAGYAPLRMKLTMQIDKLPVENIDIYGLSGGNSENRNTGVASLGLDGSKAFGREFEILVLPNSLNNGGFEKFFLSNGRYEHGADIYGNTTFSFFKTLPSQLPRGTSLDIYEFHEGPESRALEEFEINAIKDYEVNGSQPPRKNWNDLAEGYVNWMTDSDPGNGISGISLMDNTRPKSN